jgi:hypothetical protein
MLVLLFVTMLWASAFVVHVALWRWSTPVLQTRALLLIFLAVGVIGLGASIAGALPRLSAVQILHVLIVYVPGCLAYVCLYSGIEERSPTVSIIEFTAEAGTKGRRRDDYRSIINDNLMIGSRFSALVRDGLVREQAGTYYLTAEGERLARFFNLTSRLLGLSKVG